MEPKRETSLDTLEPYVKMRVEKIISAMEKRGFDPVVFEARRSFGRQKWLYGVGRTHNLKRKPITWTLHSLHLPDSNGLGKAVDIISKGKGWNDVKFFDALEEEAAKVGMHVIPQECCHLQWQG